MKTYEEMMPKELNEKVGMLLSKSLDIRMPLHRTEKEFEEMLNLKGENLYWVVNVARGYYPHIRIK